MTAALPEDYVGADTREAAVSEWIASDPSIADRVSSLTQTEPPSGKIIVVDDEELT